MLSTFNGQKLKELRAGRDLSQVELAKILYKTQHHISQIESGVIQPTAATLKGIADYFGVTMDELMQ